MTDERRQHARIAFHAPARLVLGERSLDVVVLDLSLKGALIRLPVSTPISAGASGMLQVTRSLTTAKNFYTNHAISAY